MSESVIATFLLSEGFDTKHINLQSFAYREDEKPAKKTEKPQIVVTHVNV